MSLKTRSRKSKAIFDFPAGPAAKKQFIIRRFLSLAGKAILAQRNQPIQTNRNPANQKCFSLSHIFRFTPRKPLKSAAFQALIFCKTLHKKLDFNHKPDEPQLRRLAFLKQRLNTIETTKILAKAGRIFFCNLAQKKYKLKIYNFIPGTTGFALPSESFRVSDGIKTCNVKNLKYLSINSSQAGILKSDSAKVQPDLRCHYRFGKITAHCHFKAINDNFYLYLPPATRFELSPFIWSNNKPGCYITENNFTAIPSRFKNCLKRIEPGSFDCRPEIGKNLVIEVKQKLKTWPGRFKTIKTSCNAAVNLPKATKKIKLALVGETKIFKDKLRTQSHSGSTIPALPVNRCHLTEVLNFSNFPAGKQKQEIEIAPEVAKQKPRFKLKLRLRRFAFSNISSKFALLSTTSFSPLYKSSALTAFHPKVSFKTRQAIFRPEFLQSSMPKSSIEKFCKKRMLLRFLTRTQARFVKFVMQKIAFANIPDKSLVKCSFSLNGSFKNCSPVMANFTSTCGPFNDFVGILGRPTPLLMTLTQLDLTTIALPLSRRRLRAPAGFHLLRNFNKSLSAGKSSFTEYEFDTEQKLSGFAAKPHRHNRLKSPEEKLLPVSVAKRLIECQTSELTSSQCRLRDALTDIKLKIECFKTLDKVPDAACQCLELNLNIIGNRFPELLKQSAFIAPPPWEKLARHFNCRLRLLPYPFGFPSFKEKTERMQSICSLAAFKPASLSALPIQIQAFYCSLKNKAFRSKYSLKAPQKWLFSKTDHKQQLTEKLAYRSAMTSSFARCFSMPKSITSFAYSWQNANSNFTHLTADFAFGKGLLAKRQLDFPSFTESQKLLPANFISAPKTIMWSGYQKISRLLLSNVNLNIKTSQVKSLQYFTREIKHKDFALKSYNRPFLPKLFTFMDQKAESRILYSEVLGFYQRLPAVACSVLSFKSTFKSRIRQYFFPYYPEIKQYDAERTPYFCLDDTSQIQSRTEIEELRANQITEPLSTSINLSLAYLQNLKTKEVADNPKFVPAAENHKIQLPFRQREQKITRFRLANKKLSLQAKHISKRLCPLNYSAKPYFSKISLPAPNFKSNQSHFIIAPSNSQRLKNSFSDKLLLDTAHWVIMLKSFMKTGKEKLNFSLDFNNRQKDFSLKHLTKSINFRKVWFSKKISYTSLPDLALPEKPHFFVQACLQFSQIALNFSTSPLVQASYPAMKTFRQVALPGLPAFSNSRLTGQAEIFSRRTALQIAGQKNEAPAFAGLEFEVQKKMPAAKLKTTLKHKKLRPMKSSFHFSYIPDWLDIEFSQRNADTKPGQLNFFAGSVKNASNVDLSLQRN